MYKQCKLTIGNLYTYRWVLDKKAIKGNKIIVKDISFDPDKEDIFREWTIDTVWHLTDDKKYLYHTVD